MLLSHSSRISLSGRPPISRSVWAASHRLAPPSMLPGCLAALREAVRYLLILIPPCVSTRMHPSGSSPPRPRASPDGPIIGKSAPFVHHPFVESRFYWRLSGFPAILRNLSALFHSTYGGVCWPKPTKSPAFRDIQPLVESLSHKKPVPFLRPVLFFSAAWRPSRPSRPGSDSGECRNRR